MSTCCFVWADKEELGAIQIHQTHTPPPKKKKNFGSARIRWPTVTAGAGWARRVGTCPPGPPLSIRGYATEDWRTLDLKLSHQQFVKQRCNSVRSAVLIRPTYKKKKEKCDICLVAVFFCVFTLYVPQYQCVTNYRILYRICLLYFVFNEGSVLLTQDVAVALIWIAVALRPCLALRVTSLSSSCFQS